MPATEIPRPRHKPRAAYRRARSRRVDVGLADGALPEPEAWEAYRANPTIRARNQIAEAYIPLLTRIAISIHRRLPAQVELCDLVNAGFFGLMKAIDIYDSGRNTRFATFCSKRVHGAIIDHLRGLDRPSRPVRERESLLVRTVDAFRKEHGRSPGDEELLRSLGVAEPEGWRVLRDGRVSQVASLSQDRPSTIGERSARLEELVADARMPSAVSTAMRNDLKDFLTRRFSRADRLIVILYYFERLTMAEIGRTLGCCESRISQRLALIVERLRTHLRGREDELR